VRPNTKLTLSLDKDIIERSKIYAREHNMSLSSLVENLLLKIISEYREKNDRPGSIVKELSGIVNLEEVDYKADHVKYLEEKYQ
jgi:hypothetical protein